MYSFQQISRLYDLSFLFEKGALKKIFIKGGKGIFLALLTMFISFPTIIHSQNTYLDQYQKTLQNAQQAVVEHNLSQLQGNQPASAPLVPPDNLAPTRSLEPVPTYNPWADAAKKNPWAHDALHNPYIEPAQKNPWSPYTPPEGNIQAEPVTSATTGGALAPPGRVPAGTTGNATIIVTPPTKQTIVVPTLKDSTGTVTTTTVSPPVPAQTITTTSPPTTTTTVTTTPAAPTTSTTAPAQNPPAPPTTTGPTTPSNIYLPPAPPSSNNTQSNPSQP